MVQLKKFIELIEKRAKRDPEFRKDMIKELKIREREAMAHVVAIAREIKRLEKM